MPSSDTQFKKGFSPTNKGIHGVWEKDIECPICHKIFHWSKKPFTRKDGYITYIGKEPKTCSKECRYKLASISQKGEMVKRKCVVCGKEFEIYPCWLRKNRGHDGSYCSRECRWLKTRMRWTNNEKQNAERLVRVMIQQKILIPKICEICGNKETIGHHYLGYDREHWLDVKWLCISCHMREHERMRQEGINIIL